MRYGSVCSGIEAATAACAKCGEPRTVDKLKRDKLRKHGHADWCSGCYARHALKIRNGRVSSRTKRSWNVKSRYGITHDEVERMSAEQDGKCAICCDDLGKFHIDHCHNTGRVRGLLCSFCNRSLTIIEDERLHRAALAYLRRQI